MKYLVTWKEQRTIICTAEVEATSPEEAVRLAQEYEFNVDEAEAFTDKILLGRVKLIEPEEETT